MLISNSKGSELKNFNGSKAFIEYSNDLNDIFENIEEYKPSKKRKILVAFDNIIFDILINKQPNPIVT